MASGDAIDTIEVAETSFVTPHTKEMINDVESHREGNPLSLHIA